MTIFEPIFKLLEEQKKYVFSESTVGVDSVFGITTEHFDSNDVCSSSWLTFLFGYCDTRLTRLKTVVSAVLLGDLPASSGSVGIENGQHFCKAPLRYTKRSYILIPIVNAKYDGFSIGFPNTGTGSGSAERGFVDLQLPDQAFGLVEKVLVDARPLVSVESFNRF